MSVLSLPRIYFQGWSFWNPDTVNNSPNLYDAATNAVVYPEGVHNDEEYQKFVKTPASRSWNLYGDHACGFVSQDNKPSEAPYVTNVTLTGASLADGSYITEDPLLGKEIQILGNKFNDRLTAGRLVDSNPYGAMSSQIFFAQLKIGDDNTGILGSRDRRMYSYWVIVKRNLDPNLQIAGPFGAVWQTAIPFDQLEINNGESSQLIAQLQGAMQEPGALGLMIRFTTQTTLYYVTINPDDPNDIRKNQETLSQRYLNGEVFSNPAYSYTLGSIGVWKEGELASVPGGRYLMPGDPVVVSEALREGVSQKDATVTLGPLLAELDESRSTLSLDALFTIPAYTQEGAIADLGNLIIKAGETEIATLDYGQYNQAAYEEKAGIIDITGLTAAQISAIQSQPLQLWLDRTSCKGLGDYLWSLVQESVKDVKRSVKALEEQNLTALSDDRSIYIEQDEPVTCTVQVRDRGRIPPAGMRLSVAQSPIYPNNVGNIIDISNTIIELDEQGRATIDLAPQNPGICYLLFEPFSGDTPPDPPQASPYTDFSVIRVMPFDNDLGNPAITPDEQLTWDFMYAHVFRTYDLVYPIMSQIIPLNNRSLMEGAWMQIKAVLGNPDIPYTEEPMWESTMYMSITRDLSKGKRQLLDRWCNLVSRGNQP
ncbi:MAG: hypothetical protein AB4290_16140 [Spirulina sp.]